MAHATSSLTLRPVKTGDEPIHLLEQLSCMVHLLPNFCVEMVTRHLASPDSNDELLCLCDQARSPRGLLLLRCALRSWLPPTSLHPHAIGCGGNAFLWGMGGEGQERVLRAPLFPTPFRHPA